MVWEDDVSCVETHTGERCAKATRLSQAAMENARLYTEVFPLAALRPAVTLFRVIQIA